MTYDQLKKRLAGVGSSTPELDSQLLLGMVAGLKPAQIIAGDWQLDPAQLEHLESLVEARRQTPMAYLRGEVEFFGLKLAVDQRVLIPRPESEDLVSLALELGPHRAVYDVGCGSGCLGLAYLSGQKQPAELYLIDASAPALEVAQNNAARLGLPAEFWLRAVADLKPADYQKDSLILANLPYLDQARAPTYYQHCPQLAAEPAEALFAGQRGLAIYRQLLACLEGSGAGHLVLEVDWSQQAALIAWAKHYAWQLIAHRGLALAFASAKNS